MNTESILFIVTASKPAVTRLGIEEKRKTERLEHGAMELEELLVDKLEQYFRRCMQSLPSRAQEEDSNRLALVYFCLHGLEAINRLTLTAEEKEKHAEHIYKHMIEDPRGEMVSFRPSQTFALPLELDRSYDLPNLSATFFALCSLLALDSDFSKRLDRHKIMKFVKQCQHRQGPSCGAFSPVTGLDGEPFGGEDLRLCYIATSIRKMCKYDIMTEEERKQRDTDIDVDSCIQYILRSMNDSGGFSSDGWTEPHSGLTFCAIASLKLLGYDFSRNQDRFAPTRDWLAHRQVEYPEALYGDCDYEYWDQADEGAFNGRENKFGDTCYSWWCSASLYLLNPVYLDLVNLSKAAKYLLSRTQSRLLGGFGKNGDSFPDPFHSFTAIFSLALWKTSSHQSLHFKGETQLQPIDPSLVISKRLLLFLTDTVQFDS